MRDNGRSVEETQQLKRLSKVFVIYHPIQIIRVFSTSLIYLFYLKYFPDFTYFGDSSIKYEKYTFYEQVFILNEPYKFPWYLDVFIAMVEISPNKYFGFAITVVY